jgi:hypothetical protein
MKKLWSSLSLVPLAGLLLICAGCDRSTQTTENGFWIKTWVSTDGAGPYSAPEILASGDYLGPLSGQPYPTGLYSSFYHKTDSYGEWWAADRKVPADWTVGEESGPCTGKFLRHFSVFKPPTKNGMLCLLAGVIPMSTAVPSTIDVTNTPVDLTITGSDISAQYGLPSIRLHDQNGVIVSEFQATDVSSDGTTVYATTPYWGGLTSGDYAIMVLNIDSDGTLFPVTVTSVTLVGNDPAPIPCGFSTLEEYEAAKRSGKAM